MSSGSSDRPFFSIIIPTYNAVEFIRRSLKSITYQRFKNYEIIIQDSLSVDGTIDVIQQFKKENPFIPIKLISIKDNGIYDAMNKGITHATGEWLLFLGSDDELYDDSVLQNVYMELLSSEFELVYGDVEIVGDSSWAKSGTIYDGAFSIPKLFERNICHQAIFYKQTLFEQIGYFNIQYNVCADWDFNHRCFAKVRTKYIPHIITKFYGGGTSTIKIADAFTNNESVINLKKYYLLNYFNKLFKSYVPVFLNISYDAISKYKFFKSFLYLLYAIYHTNNKLIIIKSYLLQSTRFIRLKMHKKHDFKSGH